MEEPTADREPIDGGKGKIMTPSGGKLRKKCFQATEIIVALTLACSCMHAQASKIQTFSLSGVQDLDARNVKVEPAEYKGRKAVALRCRLRPPYRPRGLRRRQFLISPSFAALTSRTEPSRWTSRPKS